MAYKKSNRHIAHNAHLKSSKETQHIKQEIEIAKSRFDQKIEQMQNSDMNFFDHILLAVAKGINESYKWWKKQKLSTKVMLISGLIAILLMIHFWIYINIHSQVVYDELYKMATDQPYNEEVLLEFVYRLLFIFVFAMLFGVIAIYKSMKKTYDIFIAPDVRMFNTMVESTKKMKLK